MLLDSYSPFDANETRKFVMLALQAPKTRLVLAHMGGPRFTEMLVFGVLREFSYYPRNVYFDLSAVAHLFVGSPYAEQLVFECRKVGLDRVMFGSDYPVVTPAQALADVRGLGLSEAEERQVLHDTATALLEGR